MIIPMQSGSYALCSHRQKTRQEVDEKTIWKIFEWSWLENISIILFIQDPGMLTVRNSYLAVSKWFIRPQGLVKTYIAQIGSFGNMLANRHKTKVQMNRFVFVAKQYEDTSWTRILELIKYMYLHVCKQLFLHPFWQTNKQ